MAGKPDRNAEMVKRRDAGVRQADIAREFGISPGRVRDILDRTDRLVTADPVENFSADQQKVWAEWRLLGASARLAWVMVSEHLTPEHIRAMSDDYIESLKFPNFGKVSRAEMKRLVRR